jgi:hypothetical protein
LLQERKTPDKKDPKSVSFEELVHRIAVLEEEVEEIKNNGTTARFG